MKVLLINASAARQTGARFIVEKFCKDQTFDEYEKVYILAPKELEFSNKRVTHIFFSTEKLWTYLFSILGIYYFVSKYKVTTIISFNNINIILSKVEKVTYFHQMLVFSQKKLFPIVPTILKFTLKYIDVSNKYLVQSNHVGKLLRTIVGTNSEIVVSWPGYMKAKQINEDNHCKIVAAVKSKGYDFAAIVPIVDISKPHKNFELINKNSNYFKKQKIAILITADVPSKSFPDHFFFIGSQIKENLNEIYLASDFMIFPSLEETLGLPIYEFAGTGKITFVLERPYLSGNPYIDSDPINIVRFGDDDLDIVLSSCISKGLNNFESVENYPFNEGDWM